MRIEKQSMERSRIIATAEALGGMAEDRHKFTGKSVLLTGEAAVLATANGRECLLNSFRFLVRMVEHLTVRVPWGPVMDAVAREADRICYRTRPKIEGLGAAEPIGFDAVLSVGATGRADLPWTVINSNGWLARVSSRGNRISSACGQANPIGALGAACLGVAEVFKRLIALRPERGELCPGMSFSFYEYRELEKAGPDLPSEIVIDAALFGVGAIGNGIVHLLSQLPVVGRLVVVDRQVFQEENWGTCFAIGPGELGMAKAEWAAGVLQSHLMTGWLRGSVEDYAAKCGRVYRFPRLILSGLDNIPARRAAQGLWPDQIIDGAIGPTLCEVTVHPWGPDLGCLRCDFEEPVEDAINVQARSTGLRVSRLADINDIVRSADVDAAAPELREWLRARQGKTICSVVSEGVIAELSGVRQKDGFEPSVPFVACLSSCMVVAETIRYCLGWPPVLRTGVQFDSLVGPGNAVFKDHRRKPLCECASRRANIELLRAKRYSGESTVASIEV